MFSSRLTALFPSPSCQHRCGRRPQLEWLEPRLVPALAEGTVLVATAPSPYAAVDQSSFPAGIIAINPSTGAQSPVSIGGLFSLPTYIAEAPNQQLYVSDLTAFSTGAIIRVDPNTGQQSVVASGGLINGPNVLVYMNGFLYVANEGDGSGTVHNLVRIDPNTGQQTRITEGSGPGFRVPVGMVRGPGNTLYVADEPGNVASSDLGKVWMIDLGSGQQTLLSQGGLFNHVVDIALDAHNNLIAANTGSFSNNGAGSIFRINPGTRGLSLITSFGPYSGTDSVVVSESGTIMVGAIASGSTPGQIIAVDPTTGEQSVLSSAQYLSLVEGLAVFQVNVPTMTTTTAVASAANPQTMGQPVSWTATVSGTASQVNFVDFETGDFSQCAAQTSAALVTSPALDGSYSLQLQRSNSVANCEIRQSGTAYYNLPTAYYSFLFESTSNPGEGGICNFQDAAGNLKGALHLSSTNQLFFYDSNGTLQATGTTVLQAGVSYTLSAAVGTGAGAAWEIRINGAVEMSGTANLGRNANGSILLGGNSRYTATYYYDDVTISSQGYSGAIPTGMVQFAIDGVNFGDPVTLSDGSATSDTTSMLSVGNHIITATYLGDSLYTPSTGTLSGGQEIAAPPGQVNFVDFETGDFSQCAAQTSAALVTSPALDGSYSLQLQRSNSVANCEIRQSGTAYYNLSTAYYSFLFESTSNPGEGGICNFQDAAGNLKGALHLSSTNQLFFYDSNGTLQATGTTVLQAGVSYTLSAAVGTGAGAAWEIRINGAVEMSGTANLGRNANGSILLGGNSRYTATYYYDDVTINSQGYPGGGSAPAPGGSRLMFLPSQARSSNTGLETAASPNSLATVNTPPQSPPVGPPAQPQSLAVAAAEWDSTLALSAKDYDTALTAAIDSYFAWGDGSQSNSYSANPMWTNNT